MPQRNAFVRWAAPLRAPAALLAVILQRTPALRLVADAVHYVAEAPASSVIKAASLAAAALGGINSLAGASAGGGTSAYLISDVTLPATVSVGQSFKMDVTVTGTAVTYAKSWTVTNTLPPGITAVGSTLSGSNLVISDATGTQGVLTISGTPTTTGTYTFTVNAYQNTKYTGADTVGSTSIVVVSPTGTTPAISTQPASVTADAGASVTFKVAATGSPAPTYQWQLNGASIPGATSASYTISSVQVSNAGTYTVVVANTAGSVTSSGATLTVNNVAQAPSFTQLPSSQTIANGSTVVFKSLATGAPAPTYQWYLNGAAVAGATNPNLVLTDAGYANAGSYTCVATNASGNATTPAATLGVVTTNDIGRLTNISCRAGVGTGGNILIAGFAVGGGGTTGSQNLLIRASGPALAAFGVGGTLPDPELQLNSSSALLDTNNGWGGDSKISSAASSVGAFGWSSPSSHDAALLENLPIGSYTASVLGQTGDTGVSLVEVYDATPAGTYTPSTPRLINISARLKVGTGSSILIAGFNIGGSTSKTVLIRASGPALAEFAVSGTLPDPQLALFNQTGTQIASNSAWGGDLDIANAAASVGAFTWQFTTSNDSAILVTLPPGPYTAQIAGASGDTGVALVEVYEVP